MKLSYRRIIPFVIIGAEIGTLLGLVSQNESVVILAVLGTVIGMIVGQYKYSVK